jgi:4-hydroxy-tetrahydrodipicolinate reductase
VVAADDLKLTALYNPNRAGQEIAGVPITDDPYTIDADVVIETAHPDVVFDNLEIWRDVGAAAVVGTSGFTPERLDQLRSLWGSNTPCLVVPNFSIGAVLMMGFAAEAASHFEAVEIIERHHATKPDAPSGTSLASAMGVSDAGGSSVEGSEELVEGARGASVEGVRVPTPVKCCRSSTSPPATSHSPPELCWPHARWGRWKAASTSAWTRFCCNSRLAGGQLHEPIGW